MGKEGRGGEQGKIINKACQDTALSSMDNGGHKVNLIGPGLIVVVLKCRRLRNCPVSLGGSVRMN